MLPPDIKVKKALRHFKNNFKLKGFPGELFRVNAQTSYVNDKNEVVLVLQRYLKGSDGIWKDFCKGTLYEILSEVVHD
jgi:hypothetical protein